MRTMQEIASNPIFFERNRVFRVYRGGMLFHKFFGDAAEDGNLPEEWVASSVKAMNKVSAGEHEGVSRVRGEDVYLDELIAEQKEAVLGDREDLGVLVKVLDSGIRLPMQAHPDRAFSEQYFGSSYGKAEMWLVLATRPGAKLYFGFREKITKEQFAEAVAKSESDKEIMTTLVNELDVQPGDVYFIPAKMIHAIGYGCLILEIQEPTDFTIQPEAWCGDYRLNEYEMYLGLDKDTALDCFDYTVYGPHVPQLGRKEPVVTGKIGDAVAEKLVDATDTPCFAVNRYRAESGSFPLRHAPAIYVVTEGQGVVQKEGFCQQMQKGDYFLLPHSAKDSCTVTTETGITLVACLPGQR